MPIKINENIKIIIGNFNFQDGPFVIFEKKIIKFLNTLSKNILNNEECKKYPDLISFGFWCRYANVMSILKKYNSFKNRIGRGTVLHIAPSNVPLNFAYSMVLGLLSGNNNIIRLPSRNFFQVEILCKILKKLSKIKKFKKNFDKLLLIKYDNSDIISAELSKNVEARVVWGGDKTIKKFKTFTTKPRCIDLTFADRYSVSLINSSALSKLSMDELKTLAQKFFDDTYTMDQFGCSSPSTVFWLGKNNISKFFFWNELGKIVNQRYDFNLSVANKKMTNLMNVSLNNNEKFKINIENFKLIKLRSKKFNFDNSPKINFGSFFEVNLKNLDELKKFSSEKLQTITYFGIDFASIKKFILKNKLKGIDRVVQIGRAFDFNTEWDGIDIVGALSRTIAN